MQHPATMSSIHIYERRTDGRASSRLNYSRHECICKMSAAGLCSFMASVSAVENRRYSFSLRFLSACSPLFLSHMLPPPPFLPPPSIPTLHQVRVTLHYLLYYRTITANKVAPLIQLETCFISCDFFTIKAQLFSHLKAFIMTQRHRKQCVFSQEILTR